MARVCLEFEKPFAKLEEQIRRLEDEQRKRGVDRAPKFATSAKPFSR